MGDAVDEEHRRVVLRNPFTFACGLVMTAVGSAVVVAVAVSPGVDPRLPSRLTGCLVLATLTWVVWRATVHPQVVLEPHGLTVRQPLRRHSASWPLVGSASAHDGLQVTVAGAERPVQVWAFSGSVLAALSGERSANKVAVRINNARAAATVLGTQDRVVQRRDIGAGGLAAVWSLASVVAIAAWLLDGAVT